MFFKKIKNFILNIIEKRIKNIWKRYLIKIIVFIFYSFDSRFNITDSTILYISDMQCHAFNILLFTMSLSLWVFMIDINDLCSKTIIETANAKKDYKENLKIGTNNEQLIASYNKYKKMKIKLNNQYLQWSAIWSTVVIATIIMGRCCLSSYEEEVKIHKNNQRARTLIEISKILL